MNYCAQCNIFCSLANIYGFCKVTACSNNVQKSSNIFEQITFPITVEDITFYNNQQLINWVKNQQMMNKDPDYGRGTWA